MNVSSQLTRKMREAPPITALGRDGQQRGLTLDENDLWVAATALALGPTRVSHDSDFGDIDDLRVLALT
jgi:predicted nucleic acid-binding protein